MRRAATALLAAALLGASLAATVPAAPAAAAITPRGSASVATWPSGSTSQLVLGAPAGAAAGDVLVASLAFTRGTSTPSISAPPGWALISRTDRKRAGALAMYWKVFAAGETAYTFRTSSSVGGVGFVSAYGGVDTTQPIMAVAGTQTGGTTALSAPSVTTTADAVLVGSWFGSGSNGRSPSWSPAAGMTEVGDAANGALGASMAVQAWPSASSTGSRTATASVSLDFGLAQLIALRAYVAPPPPPPPPPSGAVRVIIDTDLFSGADDVGALATLFGLQLRGEAQVLAIGINTRTSRPTVAENSWRCAAAIAQFYGGGSIPIGTTLPNNGTQTASIDFIRPCANLASGSTPRPTGAVSVFRRVLAAQPDNSVVMVGVGYHGNFAALLDSPADAISPLTGRDLIAAKVQRLVVMAGGYPSSTGETNIAGDPAAAQRVSTAWPTPIVWSGYEVGDAVRTASTIPATHPTNSPVRVAYGAFIAPGNWYYSYDQTAVYHAVRPADPLLTRVGPGTNVITSTGANSWSASSAGTQWYLRLGGATQLGSAIDALMTTLPGAPPPPPPSSGGPSDTFDSGVIDTTRWTVSSSGSTVAASGGELQISHAAGAWTKGTLTTASTYDHRGKAVQVQVKRPANNGLSGASGYGETTVRIFTDSTHYAELFFASGALTAHVNSGSGNVNLTPTWPAYNPTTMQWVRIREASGTLFFEYAGGSTSPGPWTTLASVANPFAMSAVRFQIAAGSNVSVTDVARFDNVSTV